MATAELDALATPSAVLEGNTALTEGGSLTAIAPFILGKAHLTLDLRCPRPRPWNVVAGRSITPHERSRTN